MKLSVLFAFLLLSAASAVYLDDEEEQLQKTQGLRGLRPAKIKGRVKRKGGNKGKDAEFLEYIVTFKKSMEADLDKEITDGPRDMKARANAIAKKVIEKGGKVNYMYDNAIHGFTISLPARQAKKLAKKLADSPYVELVEEDVIDKVLVNDSWGVSRVKADLNPVLNINAALDTKVDATIAVLDTGCDLDHPDLNIVQAFDCTQGGTCISGGSAGDDDSTVSHGTHVAGSAAAIDNGFGVAGIAPGAALLCFKVCSGSGSCPRSNSIAALDYIVANHGDVDAINFSIGGSGCDEAGSYGQAFQRVKNAGIPVAAAAGNWGRDAGNYQPACYSSVITVGGMRSDNTKPGWSNYGDAVDIWAPGASVLSTAIDGGYRKLGGTSMASPHVAGALALVASRTQPVDANDVQAIYDQVIAAGVSWSTQYNQPLLDVSDTTLFNPPMLTVCSNDADCPDNGIFCDGAPVCSNDGVCQEGSNPCLSDETCNEDDALCIPPPECSVDEECPDNGVFCDGSPVCLDGTCQAGSSPCQGNEVCDEAIDQCVLPSVQTTVRITVITDRYPGETDWYIRDSTGAIVAQEGYFVHKYWYETDDVVLPDGIYTVEVTDNAGDGLCCSHGNGSFEVTAPNGDFIMNVKEFTNSASASFTINNGSVVIPSPGPAITTANTCTVEGPAGAAQSTSCTTNSDCCEVNAICMADGTCTGS